ncbi:Glycogen debranching enzyme, partial [Paramicrosporidium saccamoebae]
FVEENGQSLVARICSPDGTFCYRVRNGSQCSNGGTIQTLIQLRLKDKTISADQIVLQTLVSKWMGPIAEWQPHLKAASEAGFNMIHFTPLQKRGMSNSPYSIYNHLELDPSLFRDGTHQNMEELQRTVEWMEKELGVLALIDVVWNHTACDSPWLADHPEAGYTVQNSPHLGIAFELDEAILKYSNEIESMHNLSAEVGCEEDVQKILEVFGNHVLPDLALWEYFVVDVSRAVMELEAVFRREAVHSPKVEIPSTVTFLEEATLDDGCFRRNSHRMDVDMVKTHYRQELEEYRRTPNERDRSLLLSRVLNEYRLQLDQINYPRYQRYDEKVQQILTNLTNRLVYERVAENGPRMGPIDAQNPLVSTYFTRIPRQDGGVWAFANNGWIWDADPLLNFAEATSDAYFTREVIVWGDCVKLRFGKGPEDSPWLWDYMQRYTAQMASLFHGFRIDNCHSTPLHVAEGLLRVARQHRPNLYVCAELFTGSEERDLLYVTRLGLNSLIREAMVAWDTSELGRTTAKYGGQPSGPFDRPEYQNPQSMGIRPYQLTGICPSQPHALYMDCTHDNETPTQRRTTEDALSNAAVVAMCSAAIGSTRGYDELVATHLNIVTEQRHYQKPDLTMGMWRVRGELNRIHQQIVEEGLTDISVQQDHDLLLIRRTNPATTKSLLLLARTAFGPTNSSSICINPIDSMTNQLDEPIVSERYKMAAILSARIMVIGPSTEGSDVFPVIPTRVEMSTGRIVEGMADLDPTCHRLELTNFSPGSVLILSCEPEFVVPRPLLQRDDWKAVEETIQKLDLVELNILLYRCAEEENDSPSTLLDRKNYPRLRELQQVLKPIMEDIKGLESNMKPRRFVELVSQLCQTAKEHAVALMNLSNQSELVQSLALTSVQLMTAVGSTGLHPTESTRPSLSAGLPHFTTHHMRCWGRDIFISLPGLLLRTGRFEEAKHHLLAFAACYYRGLIPNLLDSGRRPRYNARDATWFFLHSLQRYCRLRSKNQGTEGVRDVQELLNTMVPMRFPNDIYVDYDDPTIFTRTRRLADIVQDILQAHARGIQFREWNAGPALDPVMTDGGFAINVRLDPQTGMIHGGNQHNCGTWMDKMGESSSAGNRGVPTTPRDGASIEITALLASCLDWLIADNPTGKKCVTLDSDAGNKTGKGGVKKETASGTSELTFVEWRLRLQENFEKCFYIPMEKDDDNGYKMDPVRVGRRGIYKDTFGASSPSADYQFRPNMVVAMAIAPTLFVQKHAQYALKLVEEVLVGPLGMRTLDPLDPSYRPDYNNGDDSQDPHIARGANYHQGPEWLWLLGFHLNALFHFRQITSLEMLHRLQAHWKCLQGDWEGLPELTNRDGAFCRDSCVSQAWSSATILDALLSLKE